MSLTQRTVDLEAWWKSGSFLPADQSLLSQKNPPSEITYYLMDLLRSACIKQDPSGKAQMKKWMDVHAQDQVQFHFDEKAGLVGYNVWQTRDSQKSALAEALHLKQPLQVAYRFGTLIHDPADDMELGARRHLTLALKASDFESAPAPQNSGFPSLQKWRQNRPDFQDTQMDLPQEHGIQKGHKP